MLHNLSWRGSANTLNCLYKRICVISQDQFLKHPEITFLHRDAKQTHKSQSGLKQNYDIYKTEVKR